MQQTETLRADLTLTPEVQPSKRQDETKKCFGGMNPDREAGSCYINTTNSGKSHELQRPCRDKRQGVSDGDTFSSFFEDI